MIRNNKKKQLIICIAVIISIALVISYFEIIKGNIGKENNQDVMKIAKSTGEVLDNGNFSNSILNGTFGVTGTTADNSLTSSNQITNNQSVENQTIENQTTNSTSDTSENNIQKVEFSSMYKWEKGTFDDKGKIEDSDAKMRKNYYLTLQSGNYEFFLSNNEYRLQINEYNDSLGYIKTTDLGDGDYLITDDQIKYVAISSYQYKNGNEIDNTYESIDKTIKIYYKKIDSLDSINDKQEYLSSEIAKKTMINQANFRKGNYKSWGGTYQDANGSICSRNFYKIEQKTYTLNSNDNRATVNILEYDKDRNWIKYNNALTNGGTWTPQAKTEYISLTMGSKEWATGINTLLNNGLNLYLSDKLEQNSTAKVEFNTFDFSNIDNWRSGTYNQTAKEFAIDAKQICTKYLLNMKDNSNIYMVELQNGYLSLYIQEFDSNGNVTKGTTLTSGRKWTKQNNTEYIGISVFSSDNKVVSSDLIGYLKAGSKISLNLFTRYKHNTEMKDITAKEFSNYMNVGWNLGNSLDSHYGDRTDAGSLGQETTWGNPYITKDLIDYVKNLGFNTIRIPVTWYYNTYTGTDGKLHINKDFIARVQDVVDYAIQDGMYVMLNGHHNQPIIYVGTTDDKFAQVCSDAKDMWTDIAEYFKDYDEHLIFESYNEVDNIAKSWNYSDAAAAQMNTLNQVFVDAVRSTGGNNSKRILMVPTLLDGRDSNFLNAFVLPKDTVEGKLLVQVHDYDSQFDQDIEPFFESLEEFSNKIGGVPIIIGEFGTKPSYTPTEYREKAASNYVSRAKKHNVKCVYWDDGNLNNFGLVNRKDFSLSNFKMINAILNPVSYKSNNKTSYNTMSSYVWRTLNQSTGELIDDKYWGTIVTDIDGNGIKVPEGSDYFTTNLVVKDEATKCRVHYVHFYDKDGKLIKAYNDGNGTTSKTYLIPENTVYIRVGINDSYHATTAAKYDSYFSTGNMKLTIGFINKDDANELVEENFTRTPLVFSWGWGPAVLFDRLFNSK